MFELVTQKKHMSNPQIMRGNNLDDDLRMAFLATSEGSFFAPLGYFSMLSACSQCFQASLEIHHDSRASPTTFHNWLSSASLSIHPRRSKWWTYIIFLGILAQQTLSCAYTCCSDPLIHHSRAIAWPLYIFGLSWTTLFQWHLIAAENKDPGFPTLVRCARITISSHKMLGLLYN